MGAEEGVDLRERIGALRANGMSDDLVARRLLMEGWAPQYVEKELAALLPPPVALSLSAAPVRAGGRFRFLRIAGVALLIVGSAGAAYDMLTQPPVVYSIEIPSATSTAGLAYGTLPALLDPAYHAEVREKLIAARASFVDADLERMRLAVYEDGKEALMVPILAKGRVGSWWETPAGIYKVETREENHFSSFGHVYQPYSLAFQGNFFIHGWPYYEDGTPVAESYSGGCIRLSTEDARRVFDLVKTGLPVIVHGANIEPDSFGYDLKSPRVTADAYLVADVKNGTVLTKRDESSVVPIASITKLVSGLVTTEYLNLDKSVRVPADAIVYTSVPRLRAGSEVRIYDLLYLLLTESSNEAAQTLASALGRETFVRRMNEKAAAINMQSTVFTDASGADKGNVSTAEDLFTLLKYIYVNRQFLFGITAGKVETSAYGPLAFRNVRNFNIVPGVSEDLIGGKVGETLAAGKTYAGIFSVKIGGEMREVAVILLGSRDEYADAKSLISFIKNTYQPAQ